MRFVALFFFFLQLISADIVCYKGDILHKGVVEMPNIEETIACRIHFEMMDSACSIDKVDITASRSGIASSNTLDCELLPGDKMVECECTSEKCNTPNFAIKEAITSLNSSNEQEKAILDCFTKILESKFDLTTTIKTTVAPTTTNAATTKEPTTTGGNETTATPDSSNSFWILAIVVSTVLFSF